MVHHNDRLQSLRGLAALCVLGGHAGLILDTSTSRLIGGIFQPNAAVILFYVLSGYVLALSLDRDGNVGRFLTRRLFRIMPVYWFGVLVGCCSYLLAYHDAVPGSTPWFNDTIVGSAPAVQWANIWPNLIVWTTSMSGVLWSVQVELFAAPLIPLMRYVSRRIPIAGDLAIIALLALCMERWRGSALTAQNPQLTFVPYLLCFYVGVWLTKLSQLPAVRQATKSGIVAAAMLLLSIYVYRHTPMFHLDFNGYLIVSTFISTWLVAFGVVNASTRNVLSLRPLVWLGDISYSFYAYATPLMMPIALSFLLAVPPSWRTRELGSFLLIASTFLTALAVTLPIAAISYRLIEKPGIRCGATLLRAIGRAPLAQSKQIAA